MDSSYFLSPIDPMQRRYETLRAFFVENKTAKEIAKKFGISHHTVYSTVKKYKKIKQPEFFLPLKKGPKDRRPSTLATKEQIVSLRKRNFSVYEIQETLQRQSIQVSTKTINSILKDEGFTKLFRRTNRERLKML